MNLTNKVTIVGAGPVGLCAALSLAKGGIPSTIVDAKASLSEAGSRAIVLDHGTLLHLREITCIEGILNQGLVAACRKTFFRNRVLYSTRFPQPEKDELPSFLNLPQTVTEAELLRHVEASPLITVLWDHEAVDIEQSSGKVTLAVKSRNGTRAIASPYLLACDGHRSRIRSLCNLEFPGTTNPYKFLIVDIKANLDHPKEHHFHFDPRWNRGHVMLMVPQPNNIWRLDWQIPLDSPIDLSDAGLAARVRQVIGTAQFEVVWSSVYRFHQRLMDKMACHRVLFLGDAAHAVNPFGARGLNSGIQDARSAACKLIRILRNGEPESIIGQYDADRRDANLIHQLATQETMRFIAPATRPDRLFRDAILWSSSMIPLLRNRVNSGKMSPASLEEFPAIAA